MFFDIFKRGYNVETLQLSMIDGVELALALFMIIKQRQRRASEYLVGLLSPVERKNRL